jgi:nucleotide-binding universal stress UspA family protein
MRAELLGSVSSGLIRTAERPVMLVPASAGEVRRVVGPDAIATVGGPAESSPMAALRTIIVGVDGSEASRDALALGQMLAGPDGRLLVAHVHPFGPLSSLMGPGEYESVVRETADSIFAHAREILADATERQLRVVSERSPAEGLGTLAADAGAALVVVGSLERSRLERVLAGSVGEALRGGVEAQDDPLPVPAPGHADRALVPDVADVVVRLARRHDVVEAGRDGHLPVAGQHARPPTLGSARAVGVEREAPQAVERGALPRGGLARTEHRGPQLPLAWCPVRARLAASTSSTLASIPSATVSTMRW